MENNWRIDSNRTRGKDAVRDPDILLALKPVIKAFDRLIPYYIGIRSPVRSMA
jgi:hypothetical protein